MIAMMRKQRSEIKSVTKDRKTANERGTFLEQRLIKDLNWKDSASVTLVSRLLLGWRIHELIPQKFNLISDYSTKAKVSAVASAMMKTMRYMIKRGGQIKPLKASI